MLIGYARVSTEDQDPALQLDALRKAGVERIFEERASGAKDDRPQLAHMLDMTRPGDVLIIWKLDRLGRSLRHLLDVTADLERRGVQFRSLTEAIDTSTPIGRLFFHLMAALAQFERDLIRERTKAGLAAARARGRRGGRKPKLRPGQVEAIRRRLDHDPDASVALLAAEFNIDRSTLYRALTITEEK
jgi:DNA invertase Pin-like site-specific DNA recombinase